MGEIVALLDAKRGQPARTRTQLLAASPRIASKPTVMDLFSGAGGLSEGFQQAGFRTVAGQDLFAAAGRTFALAHPAARFVGGPIQGVSAAQLLEGSGIGPGELDVLVGGPPCQGYSYYNHGRGEHDPRAGLFREYLRIVAGVMPRWLVMENVAGITSVANGAVVREIHQGMQALGYRVAMALLRAEDHGVPQERRRMFFIATREDRPILFPLPTHGPSFGVPFVTIRDAIGDLPDVPNGGGADATPYGGKVASAYARALREGADVLSNHRAPRLHPKNLERLAHIPEGGSWRDIPHDLLPAGMTRAKRSDHTKRYGRPHWGGLSCTVLTKCDVHWGAFFHPEQPRAITPREAARLQSFPDRFAFQGSQTEQFVQVGNAVPPLLARAVAAMILTAMESATDAVPIARVGMDGELELAL